MYLDQDEQERVTALTARVERNTGAQVVTAVVGKSDSYPEIPWKAFALGAALAALAVAALSLLKPAWPHAHGVLWAAGIVVLAGATAALATTIAPPLARLFLDATRRQVEVRQRAQALFLDHGLHATRGRIGVLIMVSVFEREVVVWPDTGLRAHLGEADFGQILAAMQAPLHGGQIGQALRHALEELERCLLANGLTRGPGLADELPDTIIQQRKSP